MPRSAPSRCNEPGCPYLATIRGRCDEHQRPAWAGRPSVRERYGLSGSAQQKLHQAVLRETGAICYWCGQPGADQVDHLVEVEDGGSKTDRSNLAPIHGDPCHLQKSRLAKRRRAAARRAGRAGGAS